MDWEIDARIANGIALLGSFMAIVMWLAPVRDIWTADYSVFRTKSTENVATSFGFVAGCFNCILWNMFASTRLETMLVAFIVNAMGLILNSSFSICYWCYGGRKQRRETCNTFMAMLFVTALAIIFWIREKDNHIVGYFAAFVNILMLFGPLAAAGDVIRNRSSKGMSLLPMIMTLLSSMVWLGFGIYIKEIPSMIPNALGVLFGIAQLFLFSWARRVERKELDEEILDEAFDPVTAGMSSSVQRPRLASLGSLIAEGP